MLNSSFVKFADSSSGSGLGAFNVNLKGFIIQLLLFFIVLMVFKRWILPPIVKTLEDRRKTLEDSLANAKATEEALARAEAKAEEILAKARTQADDALSEAKKAGANAVAEAETAAGQRAALIIKEAEAHLAEERDKLRQDLRGELSDLVASATEKVIQEKLDAKRDMSLIERAIRGIKV